MQQWRLFDEDFSPTYNLKLDFEYGEYDFLFFDEPISNYDLTSVRSKINSFDQLRYFAEVFFYLNPDVELKMLQGIFQTLGNREFGKTIRTYGKKRVVSMCEDVYRDRKVPYCNQWRKILFNPRKIISSEEKMAIAGILFKKHISITKDDVWKTVQEIIARNEVITDVKIASNLRISQKTIQRTMTKDMRRQIKISNAFIKRNNKVNEIIEYIDLLSEGGNDVKIRELRKFVAVKDYSLIKEAFSKYKESL